MTDSPLGPGSLLAGRFTLEDLLDENDGARFWRATDRTLARSVAVHVLPDSDPRADALLAAARSSALVSDVHLLRVLDAAAADGLVYVVNEWGSGVSLDRLLADGPLTARRAAWVVKEVAEAVSTAHRNGIAHGRLLPENVMISEVGSVKLIGFVVDAVLRTDDLQHQELVTGGDPVGATEADVLNLAGLLYAALVGRWPGTVGSAIPPAPVEHGRPLRPRRVRAGVPRPLDAICERVLNADSHPHMLPIETAHEIYAALSDYIGDPEAVAPPGSGTGAEPLVEGQDDGQVEGQDDGQDDVTGELPAVDSAGDSAGHSAGHSAVTWSDPDATQAGVPTFLDDPWPDREHRVRSTPPPPLPEQPERPLFADGPPAAPATGPFAPTTNTGPTTGPTTGHTTGPAPGPDHHHEQTGLSIGGFSGSRGGSAAVNRPVPSRWGPDADQIGAVEGPWLDDREDEMPGRTWLVLAVALAVVVAIVVGSILAVGLQRRSDDDATPPATASPSPSPSATPRGTVVKIAGVKDFDPLADPPEENPDLAKLAIDGLPGTAWQTVTYQNNPKLGGLKAGVGLLVDLGKAVPVSEVRLTLLGSPTSLQILGAPGATSAPTTNAGLTTMATADGAGTRVTLRSTKTVTTRWLVVWLTSLPPVPGGYRGQVAEISVRS